MSFVFAADSNVFFRFDEIVIYMSYMYINRACRSPTYNMVVKEKVKKSVKGYRRQPSEDMLKLICQVS